MLVTDHVPVGEELEASQRLGPLRLEQALGETEVEEVVNEPHNVVDEAHHVDHFPRCCRTHGSSLTDWATVTFLSPHARSVAEKTEAPRTTRKPTPANCLSQQLNLPARIHINNQKKGNVTLQATSVEKCAVRLDRKDLNCITSSQP